MRRRLLAIAALVLAVIVAVTFALAYQVRRNQTDLIALWSRSDAVGNAMRLAAMHLGRMEVALASSQRTSRLAPRTSGEAAPLAPETLAALQPDIAGLRRQLDQLAEQIADDDGQKAVKDALLTLRQLEVGLDRLGGGAPAVAGEADRALVKLRQTVDRLGMRISELSTQDVTRYTVQQIRQTGRLLLVIIIAAVAGSVLAGYHILRVADLLDDFVSAARRLSEGDWAHRVAAPPTRELRELADSFNHMADAIGQAEAKRMEAAGEMLVTLNHEVGNAAGSISALVQLLRRHELELTPNVATALRQIQDTIDRLAKTVARLRDFSSLRVTEYPGGLKMFEVADAAADVRQPATTERPRGP